MSADPLYLIAAFVGIAAKPRDTILANAATAGFGFCAARIDCRASIDLHQQEEHSREGRTKHHSYPTGEIASEGLPRQRVDALVERAGKGLMARDRRPKPSAPGSPHLAVESQRGAVCSVARVRRARWGRSRGIAKRAGVTARRGRVRALRQGPGHTFTELCVCDTQIATSVQLCRKTLRDSISCHYPTKHPDQAWRDRDTY